MRINVKHTVIAGLALVVASAGPVVAAVMYAL